MAERICKICGKRFIPHNPVQVCCDAKCSAKNGRNNSRDYQRQKRAQEKKPEKKIPKVKVCDSYCNGCIYQGYATGDLKLCEYMLRTEKRRPCPAGTGCTVKQVGERTKAWREENDETWIAKQQRKKKPIPPKHEVYHKQCPVCGKIFETGKSNKLYCCEDCAVKAKIQKDATRQTVYRSKKTRAVYHRACPNCGAKFDTENVQKQFCCRKCMVRHTQRQRQRKKKGIHPDGDANI